MFTLDHVVPRGRSFDEYGAMFALSAEDLGKRILGCADGPASFNSACTRHGGTVVSSDPLYRYSATEIAARIAATYDEVLEQTRRNSHEFVWRHIGSVEELGRVRMAAMDDFLADYTLGRPEGRYVEAELPNFPFQDGEFDLALCSHFLFLYSPHRSLEFHLESIRELCRVAGEVRIFPLVELGTAPSRHLEPVLEWLAGEGFDSRTEPVAYEFQKGGNRMLRVITIPSRQRLPR